MFRKLLVAVDLSTHSPAVFEPALDLAKAIAAHVILLNVLSPEEEASPRMPALIGSDYYPAGSDRSVLEIYQELWQNYQETGQAMLRSLVEQATARGISAEFVQSFGSPGKVICAVARDLEVDLILVGHRGMSGLNELILGSTSNYVLHHAPCSVLTVQHHARQTTAAESAESADSGADDPEA